MIYVIFIGFVRVMIIKRSFVVTVLGHQELDLFNHLFIHHELCFLCCLHYFLLLLNLLHYLLFLLLTVKRSKPRNCIIERILENQRIHRILLHLL